VVATGTDVDVVVVPPIDPLPVEDGAEGTTTVDDGVDSDAGDELPDVGDCALSLEQPTSAVTLTAMVASTRRRRPNGGWSHLKDISAHLLEARTNRAQKRRAADRMAWSDAIPE